MIQLSCNIVAANPFTFQAIVPRCFSGSDAPPEPGGMMFITNSRKLPSFGSTGSCVKLARIAALPLNVTVVAVLLALANVAADPPVTTVQLLNV